MKLLAILLCLFVLTGCAGKENSIVNDEGSVTYGVIDRGVSNRK